MTNTPRFSVAMATYNGECFLQEQLDSITRQSLLPYELVVFDDGSTDATFGILQAFAAKAPFPVRIYKNERNLGYADSFLRAAARCKGDWIAFCDQDDVWLDDKLAHCAEVLQAHPHVDLLSHSADQVDEVLRPAWSRIPDHRRFVVKGPLRSRPLAVYAGFTCCVRRSLLELVTVNDRPESIYHQGRQAHDRFIYHVANTYGYIAQLPESLALYRRHGAALTGGRDTGVYAPGLASKIKNTAVSHAGMFTRVSESALQHRDYYRRMARRTEQSSQDSEFVEQSKRAIAYYEFIATAYRKRAEIHASKLLSLKGVTALVHAVTLGTYTGFAGGAGLGASAFLHDIMRTVLPRRSATYER